MSLADLRRDYTRAGLSRANLAADPLVQFRQWLDQAVAAGLADPNAMTLATATPDGVPSARIVLLKGVDQRGFSFFTNYQSAKGSELAANPHAALVFLWADLERQIRITGTVTKLPLADAEAYYRTRPKGSRLSAWISRQSEVVASREVLEKAFAEIEQQHPGEDIPLPPFWGGYVLAPQTIEFWQGRPSRLHDRFRYTRQADGNWLIERLSP